MLNAPGYVLGMRGNPQSVQVCCVLTQSGHRATQVVQWSGQRALFLDMPKPKTDRRILGVSDYGVTLCTASVTLNMCVLCVLCAV